jgi:prephenate dehydratase
VSIGYQGEPLSYSHQAAGEMLPGRQRVGFASFPAAFSAFDAGEVDCLALPIENSTTGSILPVLDRLVGSGGHIAAEHLVEVRHALLAHPQATFETIERVHSHPEALSQAQAFIARHGWDAMPEHDTAGAVRLVAERGDPREACLARAAAAEAHGLVVLAENCVDRGHNTTRFVLLVPGPHEIASDADKTTVVFETSHHPGALALALTELGLRGANLTRIESRPTELAWSYQFFVDLLHRPGKEGFEAVFQPALATLSSLHYLGTYRSAR